MEFDPSRLIATFISFFAVVDPIGTVPVFIAFTTTLNEAQKRKVAVKATIIAAVVLCFFVLGGEVILDAMQIPLAAFQISGGVILFLFAMTMIFGESKPDEEMKIGQKAKNVAVYPLAIPSIASPGAMLAAVLLTENDRYNVVQQAVTTGLMLSVLLITFLLMILSSYAHRLIGNNGASVISRVMGIILAAVAMENCLAGIRQYFQF
tara:strand:- start:865 stop:1485 length:621 start_codon:yes stop_codon:yes gene_type:complete